MYIRILDSFKQCNEKSTHTHPVGVGKLYLKKISRKVMDKITRNSFVFHFNMFIVVLFICQGVSYIIPHFLNLNFKRSLDIRRMLAKKQEGDISTG